MSIQTSRLAPSTAGLLSATRAVSIIVDLSNILAAAVAAVLDGSLSVDAAIESLMTRPFRAEV